MAVDKILGLIVTSGTEIILSDLTQDGKLVHRPGDNKSSDPMSWPLGAGMRRIVDVRKAGKQKRRPYLLLSSTSLAHPKLPVYQGYNPTPQSISEAMEDRASRVTSSYIKSTDATALWAVKLATFLSIGLVVIIAAAAFPNVINTLTDSFDFHPMFYAVGLAVLLAGGYFAYQRFFKQSVD